MNENPISKPPYSSKPPESGQKRKLGLVDDFLRDYVNTAEDREILKSYLKHNPQRFTNRHLWFSRRRYGERFDILIARVDELTLNYGCSSDAVRRILLQRLDENEEDFGDESEPVNAFAKTIPISQTGSDLTPEEDYWMTEEELPEDLTEYVRRLKQNQRELLRVVAEMDPNDRVAFKNACSSYRGSFLAVMGNLNSYQRKLGCELDWLRQTLLNILNGDHHVENSHVRPKEDAVTEEAPLKSNSWITRLFGRKQG